MVSFPTDSEIFESFVNDGGLKKCKEELVAMNFPEDTVLAIGEDNFMRKDSSQILFYGREFLDTYAYRLSPAMAAIICLMDGKRTIGDIAKLLREYTGDSKEIAEFKVRRPLIWIRAFEESYCKTIFSRQNEPQRPFKQFDPGEFVLPDDQIDLKIDLEKPISMMWMPTSVCQTDCVYCYATRKAIPESELLSDKRVMELFDEAADIGIISVNVDGGDALCRKGIAKLLAYGTSLGLAFDISTKAYISKDMAKSLVDAGINLMQIGFDAPTPELFDETVGVKGHFHRTIESIKNCAEAGLTPRTNSILTQKTAPHIRDLVKLLHTLPLRDMKIASAFRSYYRYQDGLMLNEQEKNILRDEIELLKNEYPEGKIKFECESDYLSMDDNTRAAAFDDFPRCGVGRETIIIAPDGSVTMCEQSPQLPEMIVGNVKNRTMLDVWQSDEMKAFKTVTREQFAGTACEDCEDFDNCFVFKGGCMIQSMKAYGTRFAPYPSCPKAPAYEIPIQ